VVSRNLFSGIAESFCSTERKRGQRRKGIDSKLLGKFHWLDRQFLKKLNLNGIRKRRDEIGWEGGEGFTWLKNHPPFPIYLMSGAFSK
jgi:hypothetical protein